MAVYGTSNPALGALLIAVLIYITGELAFRFTKRRYAPDALNPALGILLPVTFGVLSLMLGFSFSVAANRFDERRAVLAREVNAIDTTILRSEFLNRRDENFLRAQLTEYINLRIRILSADTTDQERTNILARSASLQHEMWALVAAASESHKDSRLLPLLLTSVNEMIDVSEEQTSVLAPAVPNLILGLLAAIVLFGAFLFGAALYRNSTDRLLPLIMLAVIFGLVFSAILDLNQPTRALIRIDVTPLQSLQHKLDTNR